MSQAQLGKAKISTSINGISLRYERLPLDISLPWIKVDFIGIRKERRNEAKNSYVHHLYIASDDGENSLYLDEKMEGWRDLMVEIIVYFILNPDEFQEKVKSLRADDSTYISLYQRP